MIQAIIGTGIIIGFLLVLALGAGLLAVLDHKCNRLRNAH